MDSILEIIKHSNWPDLVNDLKRNSNESNIYRGHSTNYSIKRGKGEERNKTEIDSWKLISSFNRFYAGHLYLFRTFLGQQYADEFFKPKYGNYDFDEISYLKDCNLLERLYYLQHYGVSTCFMDFTKNPLIALYFAIASVKAGNAGSMDKDYNPYFHPNEPYISIFEINHIRISALLNVNFIEKDFSKKTYDTFKINNHYLAFDIHPLNNCQTNTINDNLYKQEGCFVLFDNENNGTSLDSFLYIEMRKRGIEKEKLIREYRLPYNEVVSKL